MSLDESYFRATGVRFQEEPPFSSYETPSTAMRVCVQYANIISRSRAWIVSLCKTSNGLFFEVDGGEMVIFPDDSYLAIRCDTVIDFHGQFERGHLDRYPDAYTRKFV